MVAIKLSLVLFLNMLYVSDCVRRIQDGATVTTNKSYVVYLVRAPLSSKKYDTWVCGGALVSPLFIITSAACVDDVEYLYAIAGYKKYITDERIEEDDCTRTMKKKVIYTCTPMKYELKYDRVEKWSFIDIALVKVESPYNLADQTYYAVCSYIPTTISINYEPRFQLPDTDGLVFGWGHTDQWRQPSDVSNYNSEMLRYASIKIMEKSVCKEHYSTFTNMSEIIDQYMICTLEKGDFDEKGQMVATVVETPKQDGCGEQRLLNLDDVLCDEENSFLDDKTRREVLRSNQISNDSMIENKNRPFFNSTTKSRKSGICQNDHGGPLVTWVGANEVLIGVASVFKVSENSTCMGPYLYTSTQCNGAFLDCILSNSVAPDNTGTRTICDSPPIQRGYDTVERYISWRYHPAGAAENEAIANVKFVGDKYKDGTSTMTGNSNAYKQLLKHKKFSDNQMIAVRPQRPLD